MKKETIRIPECWICMDEGFVLYKKRVNETEAEYIAHCTCKMGSKYAYDGTKCEKKSEYRVPSIVEVMDPQCIAKGNFHRWWEAHKNKDGIEKALQERGIPIPKDAA